MITTLFTDENEFNYQKLAELEELSDLSLDHLDAIVVLDLSETFEVFASVMHKRAVSLSSIPFIFILDDERTINHICRMNLTLFETVSKPFRVVELFAKIRILSTNLTSADDSLILLNGNCFDTRKSEIKNDKGDVIRLTEKENKLIKFLYNRKEKITPKDVLLKSVWGYAESISTHTLETHIYRLRKKIDIGLGETDIILKNSNGYFLNIYKRNKLNEKIK